MQLRGYQRDAADTIIAECGKVRSTLLVLPTGCGKTVVFSHVIKDYPKPGRWLVLAHREELIRQAANKIEAITGEPPDIEMANERADLHMWSKSKVVVATVQTLCRGRMKRFDWKEFAGIITDEAHHATADSYQKVYDYAKSQNPDIRHIGVTATPDRSDEAALGHIFESVAYTYDLVDAINDGFLVDVKTHSVEVDGLDFSRVRTTAGDLNGRDLAEVMEYEENLHKIAQPTLRLAMYRKTLVFAASLAHAERLCEIFNRYRPGSSRWFSGETPKDERRLMLADFAAGVDGFQFLINVGVLTEGYDEPTIEMIVMGRATKSRALYSQMVGRGTRPLPGIIDGINDAADRRAAIASSDKPDLLVLDFFGNSGSHKLVTSADILGGTYPDDVVARAKMEMTKTTGQKAANVQESLRKAERDIHADKKEREAAKRRNVKGTASYKVSAVDPFDIFGIEPPRVQNMQKGQPITDAQRKVLEGAGIDTTDMMRDAAGKVCQEIFARRANGQCTFKQAKLLKKYGYDTSATFAEARVIIDALAANNWRRPNEVPDRAWTAVGAKP